VRTYLAIQYFLLELRPYNNNSLPIEILDIEEKKIVEYFFILVWTTAMDDQHLHWLAEVHGVVESPFWTLSLSLHQLPFQYLLTDSATLQNVRSLSLRSTSPKWYYAVVFYLELFNIIYSYFVYYFITSDLRRRVLQVLYFLVMFLNINNRVKGNRLIIIEIMVDNNVFPKQRIWIKKVNPCLKTMYLWDTTRWS
jgi:hypothetical protein